MLKKIVLFSILLMISSLSYADVRVYVEPASIASGATGKVYVKVDGFVKVSGFQLNLTWDPTKLSFQEVGDASALNMDPDNDFTSFPSGKLRASWSHPQSSEANLANGTTLFSITFEGICGSTSLIDIVNDGFFTVQFNDTNGDPIPHTVTPGNITVTGTPCGGAQTVVKIPTLDANADAKNCIGILAGTGFTSVTGLSFEINFDSKCASFNEISNINSILGGLSSANFDVSQSATGKIKLNWTSTVATSLGANSKLFDLCLTPNKSCCNTTSAITLSNVTITLAGGSTNNLTEPGGINIKCGTVPDCNPTGFAMIASDHCALPQETITMDFTVKDFSKVAGMQFAIDWDPTCLQLNDEGVIIPPNKPIAGLNAGKFNPSGNGCMIVLWDDATGEGVSVPDGTIIFSLSFKVLGSLGTNCSVNIGSKCLSGGMEFVQQDGTVITASTCSGDVQIKECEDGLKIVDIAVQNSKCENPCTGSIEIQVAGGTNPVITWSQSGLSGTSVTGLCPGSYSVTVTSGTETATKTYQIALGTTPISLTTGTITPATSGNNGAIDINVSGGTGAFTYQWSTNPVTTTQDLTNIAQGNYTVTVTDSGSGCAKTLSVTVPGNSSTFKATISALKYGEYDLSCSSSCDGALTAVPDGGAGNYTYKWSFKDLTTSVATGLCAGSYTVTVTDGAGATAIATYTLKSPPKMYVDFEIIYPSDEQVNDGSIQANVFGGKEPYQYNWTGQVTSSEKEISNLAVGTYYIIVTDANGCSANNSTVLTVGGKGCFSGIGAITPNGDGKNDRLLITCASTTVNKFAVFNRWGQLVYEESNYKNGWEGIDKHGTALPDGGYYWILEVKETNGSTQVYKGSVSIIRSFR